nr:MAG TPA: EMI domain [Caudoviricetes sp.]
MIYFSGNLYLCDVDVVLIVLDKCCPGWKVGAFLFAFYLIILP